VALHPHLIVPREGVSQRFTSPQSGPRERIALPQRGRAAHAQHLLTQLAQIEPQAAQRVAEQKLQGVDAGNGIYLVFESAPDFELKFESLDVTRSGIELCAVRKLPGHRTKATVFVPDGKLAFFLKRVVDYRDANTTPRQPGGLARPKHQDLVDSISDIRLAALEALWTDDPQLFPARDATVIWEVWLRRGDGADQLERLRDHAAGLNIEVGTKSVKFIDRTIVLVRATADNLARSIDLLGAIAELRLAKTTASLFTDMTAIEQQVWVDDLAQRLNPPLVNAPYVCLLDTGVNHAHPLLSPVIVQNDLHTYNPAWGADDRQGHGTPMAGLISMGDLADL
jgi:Subtilase family